MLWPFPLAETLPAWLILLLSGVDLVIRVLAVGIIPGNRRPTTAMAWLLGLFFVPALAPGFSLSSLFSTHPPLEQRLSRLAAVSRELGQAV